jgi:hypothetical protein
MSEKIDDADMQRSWSKVNSITDKKRPKKKSTPTLADPAADAKPGALDGLRADAQLLARTILERQKKGIPAEAMPDIISLAERFAQADEGMWGAARAMAFREEPVAELIVPATENTPKGTPPVGTLKGDDSDANVLFYGEKRNVAVGKNYVLAAKCEAAAEAPKLKVRKPEPEKKVHAVFDDIEFDDALLAKMMANIAKNGMSVSALSG